MITRDDLVLGMERGKELKCKAKEKNIPIWWISKVCGMNDSAMSRLLRNLSEEDYKRLNNVIDTLAAEQRDGDTNGK